jgi:oligoribonuclease NrnB/cAMP/cGMP phosphodiesterase (DHH superfamily)
MVHCFYHNDLDGHCAGAIVQMYEPNAVMHEINYGYDSNEIHDNVDVGDTVYIVDFSFRPEDFQSVLTYAKRVIWIDHHESAIQQYAKFFKLADEVEHKNWHKVEGIQDTSKAGAQLTWEYFRNLSPLMRWHNPMRGLPLAVHYVSKWDMWDHSDPRTIPFNRGLQLTESTDPANETAMTMWTALFENNREGDNRRWNVIDQVLNVGTIGEAMKAQYDFKIAKNAYYIPDWQGYRTVALNSYVLDSYCIFDHADKWEEFSPEVLVWYYQTPDGQWLHSLRAYPGTDTNVREIAEGFGGGGHDGAAGCRTEECIVFPDPDFKKEN